MKIYFSPEYGSNAYVNLKDWNCIIYNSTVVGIDGLVSLIELYLGIHHESITMIERQAQWLKCMRKVMDRGVNELTESWTKNALGVSNLCLQWRDKLSMAKWANHMDQPGDRFLIIAEADKLFGMPAIGDRILRLLSSLDKNPFEEESAIFVGVSSPQFLMPVVAELLERLAMNGVEIIYENDKISASTNSNLAKAQSLLLNGTAEDDFQSEDESFRIWEFETVNDAYRYIVSIPKEEYDLFVLSDGKLLDNTQQMLGQPTSGSMSANSSPQIVQMFLLGMNLFEYPININNLLAWLQLPLHPIKSELRRELVNVIVDTTGFDNDRYHEAIARYLENLDDDKERDKIELALDTFDVRPSAMVNMTQLRTFNNAMFIWASQMSAIEEIAESKRQQLYVVSSLCRTLETLLEDISETEIPYRRLEAAISTLYNGAEFCIYDTQAGSRFTADCANIVSETDSIIWCDCFNYTPMKSPFDFLNSDERQFFSAQGCKVQEDNHFNRAAVRCLKMPVMRARKRCVIVTARRSAGTDTIEHPIMIQLKKGFPKTLKHIVDKPSLEQFENRVIKPVNNEQKGDCIRVNCPLPMPDHESYSSLNLLIQYPFDYVLEKIASINSSTSTNLKMLKTVMGDVAHSVIETLFYGNADDISQRIEEEYDQTIGIVMEQEGALLLLPENELDCKQFKSELRECLDALLDIIKSNDLIVLGREEEIRTKIGLLDAGLDLEVKGYIDMVLQDRNKGLYVFDFKWTSSRAYYRKLLAQNLSLQLALYKKMLECSLGRQVVASAYFTMPRHEMFTTSSSLKGPHVTIVEPENKDDLVQKAINSYRYRRANLEKGFIDFEEGRMLADLNYTSSAEQRNLFPLDKMYEDEECHAFNKFSNYNCFKSDTLI